MYTRSVSNVSHPALVGEADGQGDFRVNLISTAASVKSRDWIHDIGIHSTPNRSCIFATPHCQDHPMRFFNAGVEVALDGSPVPSGVAAPLPLRSPPPPQLAASFAGHLSFRDDDGGNDTRGSAGTPSAVSSTSDAGGLPRFSMGAPSRGRNRPPAASPGPREQSTPPGAHSDRYAQCSSDENHQPELSSPAVDANHAYARGQAGYPPVKDVMEVCSLLRATVLILEHDSTLKYILHEFLLIGSFLLLV